MSKQIAQWRTAFCQNIAFLRKKHGLTQARMASIMGVHIYSIRLLEKGVLPKRLPYTVIYALCDYFDVSADDLFVPME